MIKAKKSLGQNFLIDQNIINKIINIVEIKDKSILEIGPGTGNLTKNILEKKPKKLIVIEKDNELAKLLNKDFGEKIKIINDDVLKVDENKLDSNVLTVFGNLPYNISTEILCSWILNIKNDNFWFNSLILMFQKEVADRILSEHNSKKYGRISILGSAFYSIKKITDVNKNDFFPVPKVDSSVLCFDKLKKNRIEFNDIKYLEKITYHLFSNRRKKIKKKLQNIFPEVLIKKNSLQNLFDLRAENIDKKKIFELAILLKKIN